MDPFSITIGVVSLIQVTNHVYKHLKRLREAVGEAEGDIASLWNEIQNLERVNNSINHLYSEEVVLWSRDSSEIPGATRDLWQGTKETLGECQATMEKLRSTLETITDKDAVGEMGRRDRIRMQWRKHFKDDQLDKLRHDLTTHREKFNVFCNALTLSYSKKGSQVSQEMLDVGFKLQRQLLSLRSRLPFPDEEVLQGPLNSAEAVGKLIDMTKYFNPPKGVSSTFTGRKAYLDELKQAYDSSFLSDENDFPQKRFVVCGLGGSGKTQFCCKFASDYKHRFWGVFTIDASSHQTARQSFVKIAGMAGIETKDELAAMNLLSTSKHPWLLLIDNANDSKLDIESYFPDGAKSLILITTRNPLMRRHGTLGKGSYNFKGLDEEEGSELLLKVADQKLPWTEPIKGRALSVTKTLGALPLALIHAGQAIKAGYCELKNYLIYYNESWDIIRRSKPVPNSEDDVMEVFSSYEVVFRGLESMEQQKFSDAVQILKLFSFLHHENIPFDVLTAAITHSRIEREAYKQDVESGGPDRNGLEKLFGIVLQPRSWPKYVRELASAVLEPLTSRNFTILPTFLRDAELSTAGNDLEHWRMRLFKALNELHKLSLITHDDTTDSYSMHPLVHRWVRERPEMKIKDQAVWCEAAMTLLLKCILLPPLSDEVKSHKDLLTRLLPHLSAVEQHQEKICDEFATKQKSLRRPWPSFNSGMHPQKALRLAKSSVVYSYCGYFIDAEKHQRAVMEYVCKMRGPDHPRAIQITLALSGTLWRLSRHNEAADLQYQLLQVCIKSLGQDHPKTLQIMDSLGVSRRGQGRFAESLELHREAIRRMESKLPEDDPAVFHAMAHLGETLWFCFKFEDAKQYQEKAVAGLRRILGERDLETLVAVENLAMTYVELGTRYLEADKELANRYLYDAHKSMLLVVEERKKQLGENPYTWLAKVHLARVKSVIGDLGEAENLIRDVMPIAVGYLGEDHLGVLAGKKDLANILIKQKRYEEAEEILLDISNLKKYSKTTTDSGWHPDQTSALWSLVECYQKQGKVGDSLRICDGLCEMIEKVRKSRAESRAKAEKSNSGNSERISTNTDTSNIFLQMVQDKRAELQATTSTLALALESGVEAVKHQVVVLEVSTAIVSSDTQVI
ncbi:hypothetical protein F5884DRAFT_746205 [Xylogone sp. PMI_703]|nr:hypothetical protein F5884DRAFT_746205 [Xylogone sp. PMI_703]